MPGLGDFNRGRDHKPPVVPRIETRPFWARVPAAPERGRPAVEESAHEPCTTVAAGRGHGHRPGVATMTALVEPTDGSRGDAVGHAHGWQLRDVEFDDGVVSHRYECDGCDAVWFT